MRTGVIHGRFQPLHLDHMKYLMAGKSRCDFLYIGITNPDPFLTKYEETDPHRSRTDSNPFTYYERMRMIVDSMQEFGVSRSEFEVIPFPISHPDRIKYYAPPRNAVYFVAIYDAWGEHKFQLLRSLGLEVEVLWRRDRDAIRITGSTIRMLMRQNESWEHLVPKSVANMIHSENLLARVRETEG
jgi:nicotinamide-nucleotide adenylyltransferase